MKKKIVFIINLISGTSDKASIPQLIDEYLDKDKFEYEIVTTKYAGHASEISTKAKNDGVDIVVAVGGDGTVNEVARSIVHSQTALGIIPCGSGNGLARHLLLPMNTRKAIEIINTCEIHELDYGIINEYPFFCTCGMGFDAFVSMKFAESGKRGPITYAKKVLLQYAVNGNPMLIRSSYMHINRDVFLKELDNETLKNLYYKYKNNSENNIGIINFSFSTWNFGAVLTGYALQTYLRNEYKEKNIFNIQIADIETKNDNIVFNNFRNKYYNETEIIQENDIHTLKNYINNCETIIYGSDQVFSYIFIANALETYLGIDAKNETKLLSIAAGFGNKDNITDNENLKTIYSYALKRFSKISTREDFGIEICDKLGIKDAEHILDPVFLLEKEDYKKLIDENKEKIDIFIYQLFNDEKELDSIKLDMLVEKLGCKTNKKIIADNKDTSIEDWLTYINKSDMVITSSFHGAAYAILFEKEFIFINGYEDRAGRILSLLKELNIKNRVYTSIDDIDIEYIKNNKIDYIEVGKKLKQLKEKTKKFIKEAVEYKLTDEDIKEKIKYTNNLIKYYEKKYTKKYIEYKIYKLKVLFYKYTKRKAKAVEKLKRLKEEKNNIKNFIQKNKENI